ncbi:MAG: cytochrome c peroxidase [Gammaproteobacteria bacterium]|jgi:cytochrome c peroxidase
MGNSNQQKTAYITVLLTTVILAGGTFSPVVFAGKSDYQPSKTMRIPKNNQLTPKRVELGKALFFDPRLSDSNQMSCATCHNPSLYWTDGLPKAIGKKSEQLQRATPTIVNVGYSRRLFWDGRARTLEEQATGPIKSSLEMNQDIPALIDELKAIPGYVELFEKAYPGEGITEKTIGKALANFERTIVSAYNSPFDRWVAGDENALSTAAKRGFDLFDGKARCSICHQGQNFTDGSFHNIGLNNGNDIGRYEFVKVKVMKGAFKTPTLREITRTAPYMHNGEYQTLEEVIEHYVKGGLDKSNLSPDMKPVRLTQQEKSDLVDFLKTLSEPSNAITVPVLPN